jgi:hypothetical protein
VHAPPKPWQKRAASRSAIECANPKARLVALRSVRPSSATGFGPVRAASIPAGMEPVNVPTPNAAVSTPAPVFESPSVSA